jgi:acyl-CoA synthetase (NDP forming)
MVFAKLMVEVVEEMKAKGIHKPVVASLAGDVEVEEASDYLYQHGIPAYAYSTSYQSRCSARSTSGRAARACCRMRV